jgi:hypothetical protein
MTLRTDVAKKIKEALLPNMYLHEWGLGSESSPPSDKWELLSLRETLDRLGHSNHKIHAFKVRGEEREVKREEVREKMVQFG